jgi:hypothetical protein
MNKKLCFMIVAILAAFLVFPVTAAFSPGIGDSFSYTEVTNLGNGTGDYAGYTEHTDYQGTETVTEVDIDTVSTHYSYSYTWSSSDGSTETGNPSGDFTFSAQNFHYINGTDDQQGYINPTVWFAMDNSLPVGAKFTLLDTQMTVVSKESYYFLPSLNEYVSVIKAEGSSSYQRDDVYGQFNAQYNWIVYFDPSSGYIVAYTYQEQDTSSAAGFSYSETLYVTATSYQLTPYIGNPTLATPTPIFFTPPITPNISSFLYFPIIIVALVFVAIVTIVVVAIIAATRNSRKTLPRHPYEQPYQPPPPPPGYPGAPMQNIDLTPKQPPVQQVVIREVVKVKCRYCGALIDSTVQNCPICGAPRT